MALAVVATLLCLGCLVGGWVADRTEFLREFALFIAGGQVATAEDGET